MKNDLMYVALALFPTSRIGLRTDALVWTLCEVGPNPLWRLRENAIRCSRLRAEGGF